MKRAIVLSTVWVLASVLAAPAAAGEASAFATMNDHYHAIHQALVKSSLDGIKNHAVAIQQSAVALVESFDPDAAGVSAGKAADCTALLPQVASAAGKLSSAHDLATARAAFSELTKPLVQYREMATGERPIVAYCGMEKKAWMQPEGPIENPYAPNMLRCGQVVSK